MKGREVCWWRIGDDHCQYSPHLIVVSFFIVPLAKTFCIDMGMRGSMRRCIVVCLAKRESARYASVWLATTLLPVLFWH